MRIISMRRNFEADHSSSTYEFYALKKLNAAQREAVQALAGEAPHRRLHFHYQGEWSDIPSDWPDRLLTLGYDILVSESYDWWSVYLSLPYDTELEARLQPYTCESDGNGFRTYQVEDRLILDFGMQLDYGAAYEAIGSRPLKGLTDLFQDVRDELLAGDLSAAWAMYDMYCSGYVDDDGPEPVEPLSESAETLLEIMENY